MTYRRFLVLVMPFLRGSRAERYRQAQVLADGVWAITMPIRHPVLYARAARIRWQLRRGTWGIRV